MSAPSPRPLEALLRDLGSRVHRGERPAESPERLPTGLPALDALLQGGLPRGRLSEIHGPPGSGRTSLARTLLASATARGEVAAWIDRADAFDPPSARQAGVVLERVLWVRCRPARAALRCAERLLETEGFALVLLDWGQAEAAHSGASTWLRLARQAASTRSALVLLAPERLAGPHAEVALETRAEGPRFTGSPPLLEALESRLRLVRHRSAPPGGCARVRWRGDGAA